jgi:general secretion pathway protein G
MHLPKEPSKKMYQPNSRSGFTMIEILVVMVIIGVLAAIGLGSFTSTQVKSRDARRKSDLTNISKALELFYNDRGEYPQTAKGRIYGCESYTTPQPCEWGDDFSVGDVMYMVDLPTDPRGTEYVYIQEDNWYALYTRLENTLDKDVPKAPGSSEGGVYSGIDCGENGGCNYRVASPNAPEVTVVAE